MSIRNITSPPPSREVIVLLSVLMTLTIPRASCNACPSLRGSYELPLYYLVLWLLELVCEFLFFRTDFLNMLLALFLYLLANTLLLLIKCFCEHGCPNNPKNIQIILLVKSENVHCFLDCTPSLYTVSKHMQPPKCV